MLGKLLKYEFKSTARTLLPLYIAVIGLSLVVGLFGQAELFEMQIFALVILICLMMAMSIATLLVIINRFRKNLLGDEGYLMFTLPVKTKNLIISKLISSVIYIIISSVMVAVSFFIIMSFTGALQEFVSSMNSMFEYMTSQLMDNRDIIMNFAYVGVEFILRYCMLVLLIYFSLSLGQINIFSKHRIVAAVIAFIAGNTVISGVSRVVLGLISTESSGVTSILLWTDPAALSALILLMVFIVLLFMVTSFILKNHLNLE